MRDAIVISMPNAGPCPNCTGGRLLPFVTYTQFPRDTGDYLPVIRYQCSKCDMVKIFRNHKMEGFLDNKLVALPTG